MARVKPSPTGAVLALATRLKSEGRDIISLGTGEPDFDTPQPIKDAAIAAIEAGATKYTPITGTAELKAAIQRKLQRDNALEYDLDQILVTSGAKQALFNVCIAVLGPGDEAIIPAPYWVSYPDMVKLADANPVFVETGIDDDFKMSPRQLEEALTDRTRLLILNTPSNPTGACYSMAELQAFQSVLQLYPDVVIEADESDGSFLRLQPVIAVVTNVEAEHLDHWGSLDAIHAGFAEFANRVPFWGLTITCLDDPGVQALMARVQ